MIAKVAVPAGAVLLVSVAAGLGGCAVGPDYQRPEQTLPPGYRTPGLAPAALDPASTADSASTQAPGDAALAIWWSRFNDPALSALVERALASNLDLESAAARLERSRALLGLSRAELLPSASGDASAVRSRTSGQVEFGPQGGAGRTSNTFSLGLGASWELDFFGGRRRGVEAALASAQAAEADLAAVRIAVTADVGDAYLARLSAIERVAIARDTITSYQDTVGLTRARSRAGLVSDLDAALAAAELDSAVAALPALEAEVTIQEHRLAVLLATTPDQIMAWLPEARMPGVPPIPDAGLPVDLLRRRPDIIAAERRVASASASIGVEVAEYFPKVSVAGDIGLSASDAGDLATSAARTWSVGPSVRWRVLDFARIDNAIAAARADERAAIADYRRTILEAVRDVEDAGARFDSAALEVSARGTALDSRRRALDIAQQQYTSGLAEFLPVLEAQRGVNQARADAADARQRHARGAVALFRALGAGWDPPAP